MSNVTLTPNCIIKINIWQPTHAGTIDAQQLTLEKIEIDLAGEKQDDYQVVVSAGANTTTYMFGQPTEKGYILEGGMKLERDPSYTIELYSQSNTKLPDQEVVVIYN